jgi:hypothetical protein
VIIGGPRPARWRYRSEIDALLTRLDAGFVGRETELTRLAAFAAEAKGSYLLVEAEGGLGKSALLAQLLLRHERGQWPGAPAAAPALLAFFIRDPGWRRAEEFLSSLNAQLLDALQEGGGTPSDLLGLRAQFSELWDQAIRRASAQAPLLLIVDGLDEMLGGDPSIADVLPAALAPHVHVIVSSRPKPNAKEAAPAQHPLRDAARLTLANFDAQGVAALLRRMGLAADLAQSLAPRVHALTQGEPLFARALAEDLATGGEAALKKIESAPPAGVHEYFMRQLRALDDAAQDDLSWRLCELLAAAKGPIADDELADALQRSRRDVKRALGPVERFLIGDERVQFFHRRLYEAVQREMGERDLARAAHCLAEAGRRAQQAQWPGGASRYALAHHAEHLADEADHAALQRLVDAPWLREHRRVLGSPKGFVRDAELAIASAVRQSPPDVLNEWRGSLAAAAARSVATSVPPSVIEVLAALGRDEEAEGYAQLADEESARARAFAALALGRQRRGDAALASATFDVALAALAKDERSLWENEATAALADAGLRLQGGAALQRLATVVQRRQGRDEALPMVIGLTRQAAEAVASPWADTVWHTTMALFAPAIAAYEHAAAQRADAKGKDDDDEDEPSPEQAASAALAALVNSLPDLIKLARLGHGAGGLHELESAMQSLPRRFHDDVAAAAMARACADLGVADRAEVWAQRAARGVQRKLQSWGATDEQARVVQLLGHAALATWRDEVLRAIERVPAKPRAYGEDEALRAAALVASAAGDRPGLEALRRRALARRQASPPAELDQTFETLAVLAAEAGDAPSVDAMIELIDIGDGSCRDSARERAATALAAAGHVEQAAAVALTIVEAARKGVALGDCAARALGAGNNDRAQSLAESAIAACSDLAEPMTMSFLLSKFAYALAAVGQHDTAAMRAEQATNLMHQVLPGARVAQYDCALVAAQVAVGTLYDAQHHLATIDPEMVVPALRELALAWAARGETAHALALPRQFGFDALHGNLRARRCALAAEIARACGELPAARAALHEACSCLGAIDDHGWFGAVRDILLQAIALGDATVMDALRAAGASERALAKHLDDNDRASFDLLAARLRADAAAEQAAAQRVLALCVDAVRDPNRFLWSLPHDLDTAARSAGAAARPPLEAMRETIANLAAPRDRAQWLAALAAAYTATGDEPTARRTRHEALAAARAAGLYPVGELLAEQAGDIAALDAGRTLRALAEAYLDIIGWFEITLPQAT